jgi:hypothetical protein
MSKKTKSSKGKGKKPAARKAEPKAPVKSRAVVAPAVEAPLKIAAERHLDPLGENGLPKRKLGLRGAAPWAARHAAKHAAEARARAAEPPPPGSARATIRSPTGAEELKQKIGALHNALLQIRGYRKNLAKGFFDVGLVLAEIQKRKLYEAKGYGSFEAFLEREIDLGKITSLRLIRVVATFVRDAALELGMEKLSLALLALDSGTGTEVAPRVVATAPAAAKTALPLKPPLGRVG